MHPYLVAACAYAGICYLFGLVRLLFGRASEGGWGALVTWLFSPVNLPWDVLEFALECAGEILSSITDD